MCANYVPVTRAARLLEFFGVQPNKDAPDHDVFPGGQVPFIRLAPEGTPERERSRFVDDGIFRFVPDFATVQGWARQTFNARTETVDAKVTYKKAWAEGQRCILPAEAVYEPNYETGQSVRWRIGLASGDPMGIAGIYRAWTGPDGVVHFGVAMLTVNADEHPFMKRFHTPGDEKRMVVILDPQDYQAWLTCSVAEAKSFCKAWQGPLVGEPAPLPSRKKVKPEPKPAAPPAPENGALF
jgi:putative SOS response-associated peptidase YedK